MSERQKVDLTIIASYVLAAVALWTVLHAGLLSALFSGLLVYSLVHMLAPVLGRNISDRRARAIVAVFLSGLIVLLLALGIWGLTVFFQSDIGSMEHLFQRLADILDASRGQMPEWLRTHIPEGAEALREMVTNWLRLHAAHAQTMGEHAGRSVVHVLIGMVIGMMSALYDTTSSHNYKPLAAALHARVVNLHDAFRRIVFAQVRIAAINAILTGIYLLVILPLAGVHLPLAKTMVLITFIAGLLPVIGNLISNTVVVIVALSHSVGIAAASLGFLIVIHKLEYFLNAKIVGTHINARAWEILIAMLSMEAIFGLPGVVAAPVFYAYLKKELSDRDLV
ncbi:AI-2E family transporter [Oxalobacteraceae bacterium OM1]|nr:AI-2E family transporter [Oxalobacteraceae bacterium OM1]